VNAVISLLARNHVTVTDLRVVDATLDDAFLGLTGRGEDGEETMANGRDAEHADTGQGGNCHVHGCHGLRLRTEDGGATLRTRTRHPVLGTGLSSVAPPGVRPDPRIP